MLQWKNIKHGRWIRCSRIHFPWLDNPSDKRTWSMPSICVLAACIWRHQMETFSTLLALCAGNSPVTGEFPTQRPVTRSFEFFFDMRLGKQSWGWWFETPSSPSLRQINVNGHYVYHIIPAECPICLGCKYHHYWVTVRLMMIIMNTRLISFTDVRWSWNYTPLPSRFCTPTNSEWPAFWTKLNWPAALFYTHLKKYVIFPCGDFWSIPCHKCPHLHVASIQL